MDIRDASRPVDGGVEIDVTVYPNSDRQGTKGTDEWRKRLVVHVRSPPLGGRANREVEEYMEKITGSRSEITKGQKSRRKTVTVYGDPEKILSSLRAYDEQRGTA
jgi:hypothetical protein